MASTRPRKKGGGAGPSAARQFSVVVEEIRSQFTVFGEALQGFREQVDRRFDRVDRELDGLEGDVALLKADVTTLKTDMALVKTAVLGHNRELKEVRTAVDRLT